MGFNHGSSTGYNYHRCRCDECVAWKRESRKGEYERNKEKILERNRAYHATNRERLNARRAERGQDPEYQRQYRQEHAEQIYAKNRAWRVKNLWMAKAADFKCYGKSRGVPLTDEAYEWIKSLKEPICVYCGDPAESIDHGLPISRGGDSSRANLFPCCLWCQRQKGTLDVVEWLEIMRKIKEAST